MCFGRVAKKRYLCTSSLLEMSSADKSNSYRDILKGTSFLGGVQVFLVLVNLVRGKFVALLLGPEGMGISNLFATSSNTIQRFASLGLNLAIVREVAESKDDAGALSLIHAVCSRIITVTALAGCLFCVLCADWLSELSFGSDEYSWQFMLLGAAVFFMVAGNGKMSVLQGLHRVKVLSVSTLVGALAALCISVPIYYVWGDKGIVPALVIFSAITYATYSLFLRRELRVERVRFVWGDHKPLVRRLVAMGLVLMAGDLLGSLCTYALSVFIRTAGGLDAVGFYQAANSITAQYLGVVFAAMSLDYFPRLTAAASDNAAVTDIVNRQSVLVALATAPLAILLVIFAPLVIRILLSAEFEVIIPMLRIFAVGVLLKAYSFPMGYITFAKGDKRLFFVLEGVFCNALMLSLGCAGYWFRGLDGLGYAMVAEHFISIIVYYIVNRAKYGYRFSRRVLADYILGGIMVCGAYGCMLLADTCAAYTGAGIIATVSAAYSITSIRRLIRE